MALATLDVYLHGERVARAVDAGQGLASLQYTEAAVAGYGEGAILLSVGLPVREALYPAYEARAFLDGLLPEGDVRSALAEQLRKAPEDTFGLLTEVGRECAGAVVIVPEGEGLPTADGDLEILDDATLAARLAELPRVPLGVRRTGRVRLSLTGAQGKLAVVRLDGGRLALPLDGTPTTHILKPSPARFPGLAVNEAACLEIARRAGLPVPASELLRVGGVDVLLVERFDRAPSAGGVRRVHQEDFVQALGRRVKYEEDGGPTLREMATLVSDFSAAPVLDLATLGAAVTTNLLIGNADAHAKNFSLHLEPTIGLTPFYDLVCTAAYEWLDTSLALSIGGRYEPGDIEASDLVDEMTSWGVGPRAARRVVQATIEAVVAAATEVAERSQFGEIITTISRHVRAHAKRLTIEAR